MALVVDRYELGPIGTNCYVVRSERGAAEAAVVDPSGDTATIRLELASLGATCAGILVTHSHWDHIFGLAELAEGTGVTVYGPEVELDVLENPSNYFPGLGVPLRGWTPDVLLSGGETIEVAGISFEVLAVAGHSPGHLAYYADGTLLSGDVLFQGSVGRVDLPGGDWATLERSIGSLIESFPPETVVYPGHMAVTTLGRELETNPFLRELRAGVPQTAAPPGGTAPAS
jgi:hydroxyacylglutathione hydrolase